MQEEYVETDTTTTPFLSTVSSTQPTPIDELDESTTLFIDNQPTTFAPVGKRQWMFSST